jgi:ribonuclease D
MELITTTSALATVCTRLAKHPVITVDTEFLRETTYYPLLCVVQMASAEEAVVIDTLASGIDLKPFFELMADEKVLKVFHAARQDIEIVWHQAGIVPHPIFDTQVAAMAIPLPTTSWSSASPATGPTRPTVSPTGRAAP